jgi:hypothetical protein
MRRIVLLSAFALAFVAQAGKPAQAEVVYPWCAFHNASTYTCGFRSFYQCLETIRGIGGYCARNPRYFYHHYYD